MHSPCRAALATSLTGQHMPRRIHASLTPSFRGASIGTVKIADPGKPADHHGPCHRPKPFRSTLGPASLQLARRWGAPALLGPCSERYEVSITFPLERDGAILSTPHHGYAGLAFIWRHKSPPFALNTPKYRYQLEPRRACIIHFQVGNLGLPRCRKTLIKTLIKTLMEWRAWREFALPAPATGLRFGPVRARPDDAARLPDCDTTDRATRPRPAPAPHPARGGSGAPPTSGI